MTFNRFLSAFSYQAFFVAAKKGAVTMQEQLLRLDQIIGNKKKNLPAMVPVSRSTVWAWVKEGKFPQPIKLGPATTCWRLSDVQQFMQSAGV
jgi:predicted DNA-binding transcriptional regulator AlpA